MAYYIVSPCLLFAVSFNGILLPKLFWPTVRKNCSSDHEKLAILDLYYYPRQVKMMTKNIAYSNNLALKKILSFLHEIIVWLIALKWSPQLTWFTFNGQIIVRCGLMIHSLVQKQQEKNRYINSRVAWWATYKAKKKNLGFLKKYFKETWKW